MRLQLSVTESRDYAAKVKQDPAYDGSFESVLNSIIRLFAATGHTPWTAKDVESIFCTELGLPRKSWPRPEQLWTQCPAVPGSRGFYEIPADLLTAPAKPRNMDRIKLNKNKEGGSVFIPTVPEVEKEELGYYEGDPQLRALALEGVKCFGAYEEAQAPCGACPLRSFCAQATLVRLDEVAADLDAEFREECNKAIEEAERLAQLALNPPAPEPEAMAAKSSYSSGAYGAGRTPEDAMNILKGRGLEAEIVKSPFTSLCSHCGGSIAAGETGLAVRGKGMVHLNCATSL